MWLPDTQIDRQRDGQTDARQSDPYVLLCFAGDTKRKGEGGILTSYALIFQQCQITCLASPRHLADMSPSRPHSVGSTRSSRSTNSCVPSWGSAGKICGCGNWDPRKTYVMLFSVACRSFLTLPPFFSSQPSAGKTWDCGNWDQRKTYVMWCWSLLPVKPSYPPPPFPSFLPSAGKICDCGNWDPRKTYVIIWAAPWENIRLGQKILFRNCTFFHKNYLYTLNDHDHVY